jgi:hypothetical protein
MVLAAWGLPLVCHAQIDASRLWVNAGFYSAHFEKDQNLRNANPGLGFEYALGGPWALTAGRYLNSDGAHSSYAGLYWRPLPLLGGSAGLVVGGFNGYPQAFHGGWFPAVLPVMAWEWRHVGLNVALVPTIGDKLHGAVSFQLKFRFGAPD